MVHTQPSEKIIQSEKNDLTGNSKQEMIYLMGESLHENSHYYHRVTLLIESIDGHTIRVPMLPGYDPKLITIDLNNDNINDLLYEVKLEKKSPYLKQQLFTFSRGKISALSLPEFANFELKPINENQLVLDVNGRRLTVFFLEELDTTFAKHYRKHWSKHRKNLFQLRESTLFKPIWLPSKGSYGLVNSQKIEDTEQQTIIGELKTIWYWKENRWIIESVYLAENNLL